MRCIKTEDLKGNEYLAKPVITESKELLIVEGTILKKELIDKLKTYNVEFVIVDEDYEKRKKAKELRAIFENDITDSVQGILEQHVFGNTKDLIKLCDVAKDMITDVVEDDNIALEVAYVREHSPDIYTHSVNVSMLATLLATKAEYSENVVKDVATGCLLHDVGLRYITQKYEDVNIDEEDTEDAEEIRKHVVYGYEILEKEEWLSPLAKEIILCHHERLDGKGFPFKYKGAQIQKTTQIVAVCDLFDRLICGLGCKKISKVDAALRIRSEAGKICEEDVMELFFNFIALYPLGLEVKLSNGEKGIVESQNPGFPESPVILVSEKDNGEKINPYKLNLIEEKNISIDEIII